MGNNLTQDFKPPTKLNTAVLFLVFNRIQTTKLVFESIKKAKPPRLYIAADGPRENYDRENEKVESVRNYILENIDWNCEVKTFFRNQNLGCRLAVSQAIDWFFDYETKGIILEDDTKPSEQFFQFINFGLHKYKNRTEIGCVCGYNPLKPKLDKTDRIIIANYPHIWGWGTWKRVWDKYHMKTFNHFYKVRTLYQHIKHLRGAICISRILKGVEQGEIDTWDAQFGFMFSNYKFKAVYPPINLIENIGIGNFATNTKELKNINKISTVKLNFQNLKESYDELFEQERFNIEYPNIYNRFIFKCRKFLKNT